MKDVTFDFLWEQGIKVAVNNVIREMPADILQKYSVRPDFSEENKEMLKTNYNLFRNQVRKHYFNTGENDENKIDGHKICACLMGASQNVPLVTFDPIDDSLPINLLYARNAVAFLAGINALYLFMLSDYKKNNLEEYYEELYRRSTLLFPKTNEGHDSYVTGRIKALTLNDLFGNDFDILAYSDMLFWIELYNKTELEQFVNQKRQ